MCFLKIVNLLNLTGSDFFADFTIAVAGFSEHLDFLELKYTLWTKSSAKKIHLCKWHWFWKRKT